MPSTLIPKPSYGGMIWKTSLFSLKQYEKVTNNNQTLTSFVHIFYAREERRTMRPQDEL